MRSAISPRLAIRILLMDGMEISALANHEQRLVKLDRLTVLDQHGDHLAPEFSLNLIEHLHGFHKAQRFAVRSEERRVGKECRRRCWRSQARKKKRSRPVTRE